MQSYLNQLLEDLANAKSKVPPPKDYALLYPEHPAADPQYDGELDYIIAWEMGEEYQMSELFEIESSAFPPAEQLTAEQAEALCEAILDLWAAFNIHADFPENIPPKLLYKALRNKWEGEPIGYVPEGTMHLEFCHYEPEECPWGMELCACKDLVEEWKNNPVQLTPEQEAHWQKGNKANGAWINPDLLDENGNFDPSKLTNIDDDDTPLPF